MSSLSYFKFHDGTTAVSDGNIYSVELNANTLQVEISTNGTATVAFEGLGELNVWRPVLAVKLTDSMTLLTTTSDISPFYQLDISGLSRVRIRVSATSGDAVNIYGKVVS